MPPIEGAHLSLWGAQMLVEGLRELRRELPEKERLEAARRPEAPEPTRSALWPRGFLRHILPMP